MASMNMRVVVLTEGFWMIIFGAMGVGFRHHVSVATD